MRGNVPDLQSAGHFWQLGLAEAQGRTFESIAVLLTRTHPVQQFYTTVGAYVGREFRMVPFDRAHVTLAGVQDAPLAWNPAEFSAGRAEITGIDVTGYSIRMVPEQTPFARIATAFGLPKPKRPYGVTLCYALTRIPSLRVNEIVGSIERALRERLALEIAWEFVEHQRRPLASREPFGYERLASRRGLPR